MLRPHFKTLQYCTVKRERLLLAEQSNYEFISMTATSLAIGPRSGGLANVR